MVDRDAIVACLEMYKEANFPLGTKKRIEGLRLVADERRLDIRYWPRSDPGRDSRCSWQ